MQIGRIFETPGTFTAMRAGRTFETSGEAARVESAYLAPRRLRRLWGRLRHRRRRAEPEPVRASEAPQEPRGAEPREAGGAELLTGGYITDGRTLLRVEHVHCDPRGGATFVELEDCNSLELSVWSADHLRARPLWNVVPSHPPEDLRAIHA